MLSTDERELLRLVAEAGQPVQMPDYFVVINPPAPGLNENHPEHPAWVERQMDLYRVMLNLHEKDLVKVVSPANGARGDLVEPTEAGHAALTT